jgi:hypothetical protein
MLKTQLDPVLWLSDARGIYIPRDFATSFNDRARAVSGVSDEDWTILEDPNHDFYWEAWQDVCDNAVITDADGIEYRVYQDGDCWLIPVGMEWDDRTEFFTWPQGE